MRKFLAYLGAGLLYVGLGILVIWFGWFLLRGQFGYL